MDQPAPLAPTLVADLFPRLGNELLSLLRSLDDEDWQRPTVCPAWTVHDIAAHLLDSACRRLSLGRDAHRLPPPPGPIDGYADLVAFLNTLNAEWVQAMRRLSPRLLTEFLALVEPQLNAHLATLDPWGPALFSVAWAGEDTSQSWFDVARELTERWHHQQQIRLAVGAPPLTDPELSRPIFDTFLRALPHRYRDTAAAGGTDVAFVIRGAVRYAYVLRHDGSAWHLLQGEAASPVARVEIAEEPAWLLLTRGLRGEKARTVAEVEGDPAWTAPFFNTLAVMA